jgi:tellurite resistance protein TerC
MAILGLRALYFVLADLRDRFHYLEEGISIVLALVGIQVILALGLPVVGTVELPTWVTLAVIVVVLGGAGVWSWLRPPEVAGSTDPDQATRQ